MITYHDIEVKVTDFFINQTTQEVCVKVETEDDNRWSNGWVAGLDLVFTGDDSLKATCDHIAAEEISARGIEENRAELLAKE
jgi:hypothetical protein